MASSQPRRETFRRRLRDQGPVRLHVNPPKVREGEIMGIANRQVATMPPTTPVYDALKIMAKEGFRRIPVADPGTKRLRGIMTTTDIINFFGGGDKNQIIQHKYSGDFFKAINEPIQSIMTRDVLSVDATSRIDIAIELMKKHELGGLPVVDQDNRVLAIVTEHDIVTLFKGKISGVKIEDVMTRKVVTITPSISILEAMKTMTERGFRRLPIIIDKRPIGMITTRSILGFFASGQVFKHLKARTMAQVLQTSVMEAAIKEVDLAKLDVDISEAVRIMQLKDVGSLLVTRDDKLVGIITERDFFKLIY